MENTDKSLSEVSGSQAELAVLEQSKKKILQSAVATLLAYGAVDIQGKQLRCAQEDGEACEGLSDPRPLQAISSSLVISSLLFFTQLSEQAVANSSTPRECRRNRLNLFFQRAGAAGLDHSVCAAFRKRAGHGGRAMNKEGTQCVPSFGLLRRACG